MDRITGLYKFVTIPEFYSIFQNILGKRGSQIRVREDFFPDIQGKKVLEVGCGPGFWVETIADCSQYLGIDLNEKHIDRAQKRFTGDKFVFKCGDVSEEFDSEVEKYDYIFGFGILHHLDDEQCDRLLKKCSGLLAEDGKFITIDPVYHSGQHFIAKWLADRDSGRYVRDEANYRNLAASVFSGVISEIRVDQLRVPYSHCFMTLTQ